MLTLEEALDIEEEAEAYIKSLEETNKVIAAIEKEQKELHYKSNTIVQNNAGTGINNKINVKEDLYTNNEEYKEIINLTRKNVISLTDARKQRDNLIASSKSLQNDLSYKLAELEDSITEILEDYYIEETNTSKDLIIIPKTDNLEDAIEYITDTFYSYKEDNFYHNRINKTVISDSEKLVDFKSYVLYCVGARYAKKQKITDLSVIDTSSVNNQKAQELILVYQIMQARNGQERLIALENLVELDILTKQEKQNYILDES